MNSVTKLKFEEGEGVEFKEIFTDKIKNEILAFLNTRGGKIFVGINDDGTVIGVNNRDEIDGILSSWIRDAFFPNVRPFITYYYDDYDILVIEIKEGKQKPYYLIGKGPTSNGVFVRIGRSCRKANEFEILQMIKDSFGYSYEKEVAENQNLHFLSLKLYCDKECLLFDETKYKTLNLMNNDGKYTNLALLLSDENNIQVKLAVYKGKNSNEFKVKKELVGSIVSIAHQILDYVKLFNDTSAKIVGYQLERIEQASYPGVALREAIINAICHVDYSRPSNIKIEFYDDRVVITSPGGIYGGVTLDDLLSGKQSFRNPGLINVFSKLNMIENYGTGLKRICDSYQSYDKKDMFITDNNFFTVILQNINYLNCQSFINNDNVNDKQNDEVNDAGILNENENRVLDLIKENHSIKRREIARAIAKSESTVDRIIKKLKLRGCITNDRVFGDKNDNVNDEVNDKQNDEVNDAGILNENENRVLDLIKENQSIKRREIARAISISESTVDRIIKKLKDKKYLVSKTSDKGGVWIINFKK